MHRVEPDANGEETHIMGQMIEFKRPDGKAASGYLATPAEGQAKPGNPAVLVIQEWWGVNPQIKSVADRYAAHGYLALVPDLYDGKVATNPTEASSLMQKLDFVAATDQIVQGGLNALKAKGAGKVGLTGYCMGGAVTFLGASRLKGLAAAVAFYGLPSQGFDPATITIPVMGHFASKDGFIPIAKVYEFEATLKKAGVDVRFFTYEADHAFCNETRPEVYNPEAAKLADERTFAFFAEHLGS